MNKKQLLLILGFIILIAGVGLILRKQDDRAAVPGPRPDTNTEVSSGQTHVVVHTQDGFVPAQLTIRRGDTVKFTNQHEEPMWPASDPHPLHTAYPTLDSLKGVGTGESYSFTFDRAGLWRYHDHLEPQHTGMVTLTE